MTHRHAIPGPPQRAIPAQIMGRLRACLARFVAARRIDATPASTDDTYLGPNGQPYERLCAWD